VSALPSKSEAPTLEQRRSPPGLKFVVITGVQLAVILLAWRLDFEVKGLAAVAFGSSLWVAMLVVLRWVMPRHLLAFHGAEHKAVRAYEAGIDLGDVDAVLEMDRTHPRCGTHLLFWLAVATATPLPLPTGFHIVALVAFFGGWAEVLAVAARAPSARTSRALLAGGHALQRWVTTVEPDRAAQEIGCRALQACLAHHARAEVAALA
jgi:uncharacterized protein YqhQ